MNNRPTVKYIDSGNQGHNGHAECRLKQCVYDISANCEFQMTRMQKNEGHL